MAWVDTIDSEASIASTPASWVGYAPKIRKMALKYPEFGPTEIAKRVGCSVNNVSQVLQRFLGDDGDEGLRDYQANKADIYDAMQYRALTSVTPAHFANSSLMQLVTSAAILEDKARLVRGQATSINVNALVDVATLLRERMANGADRTVTIAGTPEVG